MKEKCHKLSLFLCSAFADSHMMLIQCSRLGAESFINKYDSDGFMSAVKVMAFYYPGNTFTRYMYIFFLNTSENFFFNLCALFYSLSYASDIMYFKQKK